MAKNEQTGPKAAKAASDVLRDGRTGDKSKTAAASALSQAPDKGKKGQKEFHGPASVGAGLFQASEPGNHDDRGCMGSATIGRRPRFES